MRVLIIEDDSEAAHNQQKALQDVGFEAHIALNGEEGLTALRQADPAYDVIVLDRMMPKMDGITMLKQARSEGVGTPVLILSALAELDDRVHGLRAGADDYLTKPYALSELIARIEALARRKDKDQVETVLRVGPLEMNLLNRVVRREGVEIDLQPREFQLLEYLMRNHDQNVTRTMLLEKVWEYHFDPQTNVIDVHISRLRTKIDKGFETPMLHTIRGEGYALRWGQVEPNL
jgi:two-component system OmpR family response regulator